MSKGKKPDYRAAFLNKVTDQKVSRIGAAWRNPDGTITIALDGALKIETFSDNAALITLFPNKEKFDA